MSNSRRIKHRPVLEYTAVGGLVLRVGPHQWSLPPRPPQVARRYHQYLATLDGEQRIDLDPVIGEVLGPATADDWQRHLTPRQRFDALASVVAAWGLRRAEP